MFSCVNLVSQANPLKGRARSFDQPTAVILNRHEITSREGSGINTRQRCQQFIGVGNNDVAAREGQNTESKTPRQNLLSVGESPRIARVIATA